MSRRRIERNSHHGLWTRRDYEDGGCLEQARERIIYRNFKLAGHHALHQAIEAPPLLTTSEASAMLTAFETEQPKRGIESFEFAEDYFAVQAISSFGEEQDKMFGLANNFARQLVFIKGDYEPRA